jgi:hypothetical protein
MAKQPKTTSEHLISIYGYITGLKREVSQIKFGGLGATILTLVGLFY